MTAIQRKVYQQIIAGLSEPVLVARVDQANWPVVHANPAFEVLAARDELADVPFTDVVEQMHGRDTARELSEIVRSGLESTIPVEYNRQRWLLALKPLRNDGDGEVRYYAAYWRDSASGPGGHDTHQALTRARRRIRDLSRDDQVTGLLNAAAFEDVLTHDWAVAARENGSLALIALTIDDFENYLKVFGRHAADSCLRRVAQTVRRCLRRASDVAARLTRDDEDVLIILFHASDEAAIGAFAATIAREVRELNLHHPHSKTSRYVTVTFQTAMTTANGTDGQARAFLDTALARP